MTLRSHMSSIMGVIGPEQVELFALELGIYLCHLQPEHS